MEAEPAASNNENQGKCLGTKLGALHIVFLENCSVTRKVLVVEEKNELSWSAWRVCHRRLNENRLFVIHKEGLPISQEKQIPFSSVGLDSLTDDLY